MPRLELEQVIGGYSQISPAQVNLLRHFYASFDNRSAANRRITNVEPIFFSGASAGSEFLTYAATKLYIAFALEADSVIASGATVPVLQIFSEANAVMFNLSPLMPFWNGTTNAVNFVPVNAKIENIYFSRVGFSIGSAYLLFNGYRITLV